MRYNPDAHHRKSIRLKEYDYSKEGMYYITICTKDREKILSEIVGAHICAQIKLTEIGIIVEEEIKNTNIIRKNIKINHYVIMPNHIHMIIEITDVGVAWYATQDKIERSKKNKANK